LKGACRSNRNRKTTSDSTRGRGSRQHKSNMASADEHYAYLAGRSCLITGSTQASRSDIWVCDSGATDMMAFDESRMTEVRNLPHPIKITLGDGHQVEAKKIGKVPVIVDLGEDKKITATISDVLLVPDLAVNLFSVKQSVAKGNTITFDGNRCYLHDKEDVLRGIGKLQGDMYTVSQLTRHTDYNDASAKYYADAYTKSTLQASRIFLFSICCQ
jgi:hypothetical protein